MAKKPAITIYKFGNADGENLTLPAIADSAIHFGTGAGDFVSATSGDIDNTSINFGNGPGDYVSADDNISSTAIYFGNGAGDYVLSRGGAIFNGTSIRFGDGAGDFVLAGQIGNNVSTTSIAFGDGAGDFVSAFTINATINGSQIPASTLIDFGNGAGDHVSGQLVGFGTIDFGNGTGDYVSIQFIENTSITFGDGAANYVSTDFLLEASIDFGNGDGDHVSASSTHGGNTITLGNGAKDVVTLGDMTVAGNGGDYIATGTGAGDMVSVGTHPSPDTFAFALGTNGTKFTTVNGAQGGASGDHVVVNGGGQNGDQNGQLANKLVARPDGPPNPTETLASFIASLGTPTEGHTYVGNNGTNTFIFTDTTDGTTGAIELVGVFHASISNHVLTLIS